MSADRKHINDLSRIQGYIHQEDFFDMLPKPEFVVKGKPARSLHDFWARDVLDVAIKLREIYVGGYNRTDEMLYDVWSWINEDRMAKRTAMEQVSTNELQLEKSKIPFFVLLNVQTAEFITLQDDFKEPRGFLVAYDPTSEDFEMDLRRTTFDYHDKLCRMSQGIRKPKHQEPKGLLIREEYLMKQGISEEVVNWFNRTDTVTWVLLMRYHSELFARDRILGQKNTLRVF